MIARIKQFIKKRRYKKFIIHYKNDPAKFLEDYLGIELYDYQKKLLNNTYKSKVNIEHINIDEMNELTRKSRNQMWVLLYRKEVKNVWYNTR